MTNSALLTTELSKKYIPVIAYLLLGDLGFSSIEIICPLLSKFATPYLSGFFTGYANTVAPIFLLILLAKWVSNVSPWNKLSPKINTTFEEPINFLRIRNAWAKQSAFFVLHK